MRTFAIVSLVVVAALGSATPAGGSGAPGRRHATSDRTARRVSAGHGISVRLPAGWHLIRRSLTDVKDPAQRLAAANFDIRLGPGSCEYGQPDVRHIPRDGAFVFMWEYDASGNPASLWRIPRRPSRFHVWQTNPHWFECAGSSSGAGFRDAGRVFQPEVYLGPGAGCDVRARVDALLGSLRAAPQRARARVRRPMPPPVGLPVARRRG